MKNNLSTNFSFSIAVHVDVMITTFALFTLQEMLTFFRKDFPQMDAIKSDLDEFNSYLPIHGFDISMLKKVIF